MIATLPRNEAARMDWLDQSGILDTPAEAAFDDITRLASQVCGAPIAAITLLDRERQWFKSILGLPIKETPRDLSFCAHTVFQSEVMVVPDARSDERFAAHPFVTGEPHIRFYAGAPLVTPEGFALGTLCALDRVPRALSAEQGAVLEMLARQVVGRIEMGRRIALQERLIVESGEAQAVLHQGEAKFRSIIDASPVPYCLNDERQNITFLNAEFIRTFGYTRDDISTLADWWPRAYPDPEYRRWVVTTWQARMERAKQDGAAFEGLEIDIRCKDGSTRTVMGSAAALGESFAGEHLIILYDVTARKKAEEASRRSEARLAEAQRVARIGSWEYDTASGRLHWSDELFRLLGMDPAGGDVPVDRLPARCHPDDLAVYTQASRQALRDGLPFGFDLRILQADGSARWARVVGHGERGPRGRVTRLFGTLMDVHDRRSSDERFRVLFEQSSDAHLLFDTGGLIDCNPAAVSMLRGAGKAQVLSLNAAALSPLCQPDGRRSDEKDVEMLALARARGCHRFDWVFRKTDGTEFSVAVTLTAVSFQDRPVFLGVWHDLTEHKLAEQQVRDYTLVLEFQKDQLEAANAELAAPATTDGLTGLKNHRAFQERLAEEVARAARAGMTLSLVMLDVDLFKQFNDDLGHVEGDGVLREVARLLKKNARDTDLAARYGGEEFVLILPQTNGTAAAVLAERIRQAIEAASWPTRAVTASLGVASLGSGMDGGTLVECADRAMYRSKLGGRNRVTSAATAAPDGA